MPKFQLGQRVKYEFYMVRSGSRMESHWHRRPVRYPKTIVEGIIVGKRTVSDGTIEDCGDCNVYIPTKHYSFWLVAHNLSGYQHVAEDDLEANDDIE